MKNKVLISILTTVLLLMSITKLMSMQMQFIPYNNQLKKIELTDISFYDLPLLNEIPTPFYKDYSHYKNPTARDYKSYDKTGFRDILIQHLSESIGQKVLKLLIITPTNDTEPYKAFSYLSNKSIIGIHFENTGNFKLWMDIILKKQYEKLEEKRRSGQFERQPELNPNPQFMLVLGNVGYSITWVNSGMRVDEKPYEKTGAYLYKNAPRQYNETKIAKEKQNYLKKYIDTSRVSSGDEVALKGLFDEFIKVKQLTPKSPKDNEPVYTAFEASAGYPFPEELKILLSFHNGIENSGFLSAQQIFDEWTVWKEIYDSVDWMLTDLTANSQPDGRKTIGVYTNPYWVPFYSTGGGNFMALDYAPGSKGTSGQIIAFGADEHKIRLIAENLANFFQQYIDGKDVLNNGF